MTTLPEDPVTAVIRRHRPVFSKIVTETLRLGLWLWPIVIAVTIGVPLVVDRFGGHTGSIYSGVAQGPRWFLYAVAIVAVAEGFAPHVALGMTRRTYARQHGAGLLVAAAVYGVAALVVTRLERAFFEWLGWPHETVYGRHEVLVDPWYLVLLDHAALLAVFALSGLAVGAVYYRWRGWLGTLALPLTVGPAFLAAAVLPHAEALEVAANLGLDTLPYVAGLAIAVAVAAWFWVVTRFTLAGAAARAPQHS